MKKSVAFGLSTGVHPYGFPDREWFGSLCANIETWGFDDVVCYVDRPTWPHPVLDPLVLLSVAAASTRKARLIGMVIAPHWPALLLAKQVASIDFLSGGRVTLGLAIGGDYPAEMRGCGVERSERVARTEEAIAAMRALWGEGPATLEGRFQRLDGLIQRPRPAQGTIPLWLAHRGRADAAARRSALLADGWMPSWVSPGRLRRVRNQMRALAEAAGRDFSRFEVGHVIRVYFSDTVERGAERMARFRENVWGHPYQPGLVAHLQAVGPPDACRLRLAEFVAAGADRICLQAECPWEEFEDQLHLIRTEILERRDEILSMAESIEARAAG